MVKPSEAVTNLLTELHKDMKITDRCIARLAREGSDYGLLQHMAEQQQMKKQFKRVLVAECRKQIGKAGTKCVAIPV